VPVRIAIGPKRFGKWQYRTCSKSTLNVKNSLALFHAFENENSSLLEEIQPNILKKASSFKQEMTTGMNLGMSLSKFVKEEADFFQRIGMELPDEEKIKDLTKAYHSMYSTQPKKAEKNLCSHRVTLLVGESYSPKSY